MSMLGNYEQTRKAYESLNFWCTVELGFPSKFEELDSNQLHFVESLCSAMKEVVESDEKE